MTGRADAFGALAVALEALGRYPLRTALNVLGVVLGVAAVIAMLSVGEGGARDALAQVEALGIDNLVVRPVGGLDAAGRVRRGLTVGDADRMAMLVPGVDAVSPLIARHGLATHGGRGTSAIVLGVTSAYARMRHGTLERGRFLAPSDEQSRAHACVLGATVAAALFGSADPVGARVRVLDDYYLVVGVLGDRAASQAAGTLAWRDVHASVLVPLATLTGRSREAAPLQEVQEIWLHLHDGAQAATAARVAEQALQSQPGPGTATIVVPRELLARRQRTQRTFAIVLGCVAAIGLLVGGIGIMNTMLTTVAERTPEIGLRRVAGARRRDVLLQFLVEAVVMTTGGGVIGVGLGVAASALITSRAGWPTHVSIPAVLMGLGVALLVGIVFGLYPALRAAALQPVDAVRYE
ncbi:multidrug ABC transporter substrate-binding protein [Luteitalea sp. TBR-22]|uniref:ABC transporter permease n=1 Tax=Luteitalea sp. TBR-22 TaxID=2802971 RepID=UPI001AFC4E28|nr:ABC transporter permease [Luteitalea sp. TBR-22]BCS31799.1 multidrug ABC transporter substrate-binding protein [Luteitalea sp. TBR-22]